MRSRLRPALFSQRCRLEITDDNVIAIPGASSLEQLEANVEAADLELTADEVASLTAASDAFTPPGGVGAYAKVAKRRALRQ